MFYRDSDRFKNKEIEKFNKAYAEQVSKDDKFRKDFQVLIDLELHKQASLKAHKEMASNIVVTIDPSYQDSIERVLGIDSYGVKVGNADLSFSPYTIERVAEDRDIRLARPDLPIMLRVSRRQVGDDYA